MAKTMVNEQVAHRWYTRPFVADVNRALRFYIDMLGFEKRCHEGNGTARSAKSIAENARSSSARTPRAETRRACSSRSLRRGLQIFAMKSSSALFQARNPGGVTTCYRLTIPTAMSCFFRFQSDESGV